MIEYAIYEHPDVEEALVIGMPDAYRGEAAKAFVKLRDGAPDVHARRRCARSSPTSSAAHELPAALEIRDSLPRTTVGKLSRNAS